MCSPLADGEGSPSSRPLPSHWLLRCPALTAAGLSAPRHPLVIALAQNPWFHNQVPFSGIRCIDGTARLLSAQRRIRELRTAGDWRRAGSGRRRMPRPALRRPPSTIQRGCSRTPCPRRDKAGLLGGHPRSRAARALRRACRCGPGVAAATRGSQRPSTCRRSLRRQRVRLAGDRTYDSSPRMPPGRPPVLLNDQRPKAPYGRAERPVVFGLVVYRLVVGNGSLHGLRLSRRPARTAFRGHGP